MKKELTLKERKLIGFVWIVFVTLACAYLVFRGHVFTELENRSWDWRLRVVAKHTVADPSIKLIMIDQPSLDIMAEDGHFWPWPRALYTRIIEFLSLAQAKGVAFDVLFTEDSHYDVVEDNMLAESMAGKLPVVAAVALRSSTSAMIEERLDIFRRRQSTIIETSAFTSKFPIVKNSWAKSAAFPIPPILKSAHSLGNVTVSNDSDGIFRHYIAGQFLGDIPILTLPFALYHAVNPQSHPPSPPVNDQEQLTLRFAGGSGTYETYPFVKIFRSMNAFEEGKVPQVAPEIFKDSYVFIGMSAPGLMDLRPTPLDAKSPGVEINATALDNLVNNNFVREASLVENLLYTLLFVLLASGSAFFIANLRLQISIILLSFSYLIVSSYYLATFGVWIHMIVPILATSLALLASVAQQYKIEGSQTRFIKKAFRYYVSPEVIEKIIEDPSILTLGGDRKELSIYFCDIAGFTSISEAMDPSILVLFLNKFLSAMTTIILTNGGTVDKYVGDAIVAFWNAPLPDAKHAERAVQASIECQNKLQLLRKELFEEFGHEVHLRIGLHTGTASVGNFGSLERFNYTVIGDAANLASRLEGANKSFGTDILFSEATYLQIKDSIPCLKVAMIKVVGRDQPISVFTPNRTFSSEQLNNWNRAVSLFESGSINEAANLFNSFPDFPLLRFYQKRLSKETENAAAENWSPVLSLNEK